MKVYTIQYGRVSRGARLDISFKEPKQFTKLCLGGGVNCVEVPVFKKNIPDMTGDHMMEAHPVRVREGFALAKPNRDNNKVLVVIRTRNSACNRGIQVGMWSFDQNTTPTCNAVYQTLVRATGPVDYYRDQDALGNIGWQDALVVMNVGDIVQATDQDGQVVTAKYESAERGLIKL